MPINTYLRLEFFIGERVKKKLLFFMVVFAFLISFMVTTMVIKFMKDKNIGVNDLGITVSENREYSFTDKKFGYYYSATHSDFNESWFTGWNLNTKRILNDYLLYIDGDIQKREKAAVTVYPHKIIRKHEKCEEIFSMLDDMPILVIEISNIKGKNAAFQITGGLDTLYTDIGCGALFTPKESPEGKVLIAPLKEVKYELAGSLISADK